MNEYSSNTSAAWTGDGEPVSTETGGTYANGVMAVVQLGVDELGEPRAIIESTNPEVRAWAERTDDRFRERAVPVEVAQVASSIEESSVE